MENWNDEDLKEINRYFDEGDRLTTWPSKRNKRSAQKLVLHYLVSKFDAGVNYSEKEVNTILRQHHTFNDPPLLRRELFENGLLDRKLDGSAYWLRESPQA